MEPRRSATASLLPVPRVWHERWSATLASNLPGQDLTPRPFTMKSPSSQVRLPRATTSREVRLVLELEGGAVEEHGRARARGHHHRVG